jgi:hypothetical protein
MKSPNAYGALPRKDSRIAAQCRRMFPSTEDLGATVETCHIFASSSRRSRPVQNRTTSPAPMRRLFWWSLTPLSKVVSR